MKMEFQYILFTLTGQPYPGHSTSTWHCFNRKRGTMLGYVNWEPAWRQYVFVPLPRTIWSVGCLKDVAQFVAEANKTHQDSLKHGSVEWCQHGS